MRAKLAPQAASWYNEASTIVVPEDAVNTLRLVANLFRRPTTMTTLPPHADNGNLNAIPNASGIYKITCSANKKIYIGSSINLCRRKNEHWNDLRQNKHSNPIMQSAWNKYGEQTFVFEVLELVLPMDPTNREQHWLNKFKPFGRKGFNLAHDARAPMRGTNGRKASPETREKMRQAQQNRNVSPENLEKMKRGALGRKQSPEHIKNRTQQAIGKKHSPEWVEKNRQAHLGQKQSPEQIEKSRQARIGRKMSPEEREKHRQACSTPEYREKKRQASLGRKHTPEAIEKIRQWHLGKQRDEKGRFMKPTCPD